MEVLQRILEIFSKIAGLLFNIPEFQKLRILISLFSIIFSLLLIFYWIYLERKYKYGSEWWSFLIKYFLEAFIKPEYFKNEWRKIKNLFVTDHISSLLKTYQFLQEVIDLYGYEKGNLKEKFLQIPNQVYNKKERYEMALEALEVIYNKIQKKEEIEITKLDALSILKEIESMLGDLFVISPEDYWANFQVVPEE